jgi:hypothetical protein
VASSAVAGSAPRDIAVFLEAGRRRVFVSALEWPGWARSGKSEELAIEALADYLPRYAPIARAAGLRPPSGALVVADRHTGLAKNADFGSLGEIAPSERQPLAAADGARLAALLEAAWAAFDAGAAQAPEQLRKGPRGGGRDTSQIVGHVHGAEAMYARKMGLARDKAAESSPDAAAPRRARIVAALRAPADLETLAGGWPPGSAARRIAWHVLDHLWEIEDKAG